MAIGKRQRAAREALDVGRQYSLADAIALLKKVSKVKFAETVDLAVSLGVDARKSDQMVRGATTLPHGTGKTARVAVFAQGDMADAARDAGADVVGMQDLADAMKGGDLGYDVVIASPDAMPVVGTLGQILGPKGLMPNPKTGTVSTQVDQAVKNAKSGQVRFRIDKNGIVHGGVGRLDFKAEQLVENVNALLADLRKLKPAASKGVYLKKITLSSTMGPGVPVDVSSLEA